MVRKEAETYEATKKRVLSYWFPKIEAAGIPVPTRAFLD
jgi:hypothetical protein